MAFDNTPPEAKSVTGATFDNTSPSAKTPPSVTFDNTAPGSVTPPSVTFSNVAPAQKALPTVSFGISAGAVLYSDAFAGVDDTNLAAPWEKPSWMPQIATYSGGKAHCAGGPPQGAVVSTPTAADAYCQAKVSGDEGDTYYLIGREQSGSYYAVQIQQSSDPLGQLVQLQKTIFEDSTYALATVAVPWVAGAVFKLTIIGNEITVSFNGVDVLQYRDVATNAILTAGKWGIYGGVTNTLFDDFELGAASSSSPQAKTVTSVTFDNTTPDTKTVASASYDNTAPGTITPPSVSFDNTAPSAKTVASSTFDNTPPSAISL